MRPEGRRGFQPGLPLLVLVVILGGWPVATLAAHTPLQSWAFAAGAAVLGGFLGGWIWDRGLRPSRSSSRSRRTLVVVVVVAAILVGSAPSGVRLVYSAALEGVVLTIAVSIVRARARGQRAARNN